MIESLPLRGGYRGSAVTPTQAATHWDALSHVSHRGMMYNGVPADAIDAFGAAKLGIEAAGLVASRGVLLDVASCSRT